MWSLQESLQESDDCCHWGYKWWFLDRHVLAALDRHWSCISAWRVPVPRHLLKQPKEKWKKIAEQTFSDSEGIYPLSKKSEILHFLHLLLSINKLDSIFLHWKCHFSYTATERVTECAFQCNFSVGISVGNFSVSLWLSASSVGNAGFWQLKSCIDTVDTMH